ncbi:hypothetical protein PHYPSEUDO_004857 [Phytophthora pseudosyringae]|uniref:Uncharacterized protein n=1 Tax=Phytophthora pseudosyringae TaxID=221518 RepID=A0A8T1VND4_9STRA|nr:hypothetical protein PHYPSEUDO_004857 [Phytophthora pseudosyringae]
MDLEALLNAADNVAGDWEVDTDNGLEEAKTPTRLNDAEEETKAADALPAATGQPAPRGRTGNVYVDSLANEVACILYMMAKYAEHMQKDKNFGIHG